MADSSLPPDVESATDSQPPGHSAQVARSVMISRIFEDDKSITADRVIPLSLEVGRSVGKRGGKIQTMPDEALAEIFSYLSQPNLCAILPLCHTFVRLSIPLLYRRLVGTFTAPDATRLFLTCIKRPNFSIHARVLDGHTVAGDMDTRHLNLLAGALVNMPNLEVLSLPLHVTERHLIDPGTSLRALHIKGPRIPHEFIARLQFLRALQLGRACDAAAADVLRISAGPSLEFVHCAVALAAHFLPPAPLARRVLGPHSVMRIFVASREGSPPAQTRAFLEALGRTCCPPHTVSLNRYLVPLIARELSTDRALRVSRVRRLRLDAEGMTPQQGSLCTRYVKAFLHCFVHVETLELGVTDPVAITLWSDESVSLAMRARRAPLRLIVYSKKRCFEYQPEVGLLPVRPPLLAPPAGYKDPFFDAGLSVRI